MAVKIIDHSTLIPGPFISYLLDKNLDVEIKKIEDINQPDPLSFMRPTKDGVGIAYQEINKSKEIIKVDFRKNGSQIIKESVRDADIFIENYKPGRAYKMGIGFDDLVKENPKLIYVSVVGFPEGHPMAKKSTHDLNILALSGFISQQSGFGGGTSPPPLVLADTFTSYFGANKIMALMIRKEIGVRLEISMWEAFMQAMTVNNTPQLETHKELLSSDMILTGNLACYHIYPVSDGMVAVAALESPLWVDFCTHLGRTDLIHLQFDKETIDEVGAIMLKTTKTEWMDNDFCVSPVLTINEAKQLKYV